MKQKHKMKIHASLVRPILIGGTEREWAIGISILSLSIWLTGKSILSVALAVLFALIAQYFARTIAKEDKQISRVFIRHIAYKKFYPARERESQI